MKKIYLTCLFIMVGCFFESPTEIEDDNKLINTDDGYLEFYAPMTAKVMTTQKKPLAKYYLYLDSVADPGDKVIYINIDTSANPFEKFKEFADMLLEAGSLDSVRYMSEKYENWDSILVFHGFMNAGDPLQSKIHTKYYLTKDKNGKYLKFMFKESMNNFSVVDSLSKKVIASTKILNK